jgi:nucleoside-diphosphate-sugar epimerase
MTEQFQVGFNDPILVTGASGFIGSRVVAALVERGFKEVRCFARPTGNLERLRQAANGARIQIVEGNLLSQADCDQACAGVAAVIHLAAGIEKSYSGSFLNTVVGTRNLLRAVAGQKQFVRFENVSSFAVYSNWNLGRHALLDESCEVEANPILRHEPYCYAKVRQEELVKDFGRKHNVPYVIVRPGAVYGPNSRHFLTHRVGIDTFGIFLHLGGGNQIPLTYVDNCADAMVLAAVTRGVDGEAFNIVDDDLPRSRDFLRAYRQSMGRMRALPMPYSCFYLFSWFWERYSVRSKGQLPPAFNRRKCSAYWKGNRYSNEKAKRMLGWKPKVPTAVGIQRHCEYFKNCKTAHE